MKTPWRIWDNPTVVPAPVAVIPAPPAVIPAKAGIQGAPENEINHYWIPAFAGMTVIKLDSAFTGAVLKQEK